ncbi:MAG TPA: PEP-CTERM sorting domain-containing protein [Crinalium sp.]
MKKLGWHFLSTVIFGAVTTLGAGLPKAQAALLVGNTESNNVVIYDERTGRYGGEFIPSGTGGLTSPDDLTFGPDGDLYISSGTDTSGAILRFDGKTGEFLGRFDQGGQLFRPYGIAFGPDGNVYVSSFRSDQILRYDATGKFLDVFATGTGTANGLNGPDDLLFGSDGSLYVTTQGSVADGTGGISFLFDSQILKYDITTGASSAFVPKATPLADSFDFVSFLGLAFGPYGDLFASDFANGIRRYNPQTGELLASIPTNYTGTSPSSNFIGNLTFDPDNILYTVGFDSTQGNRGAILRYDGTTGKPLPASGQTSSLFVPPSANLQRPIGIAYAPITVPEPGVTIGLLTVGTLWGARRWKRDRPQRLSDH